jgi:hypothetical protein
LFVFNISLLLVELSQGTFSAGMILLLMMNTVTIYLYIFDYTASGQVPLIVFDLRHRKGSEKNVPFRSKKSENKIKKLFVN